MKAWVVAVLVGCLVACSRPAPPRKIICVEPVDRARLSEPERLALGHAGAVSVARCTDGRTQCQFSVRRFADKIVVRVDHKVVTSANTCGQAPGDSTELFYDLQGRFLERGFGI